MLKISAAELVKRVWSIVSQLDTLAGLVGWIGGPCLGSILASRVMNPANVFVPLSWFFGTIFVTVLAVKTLNLLWSKRDHLPWIRSKHHAHGGPSMRASAVLDTPSQLERERDGALLDLARERDALSKDLKACKVEFSHAKLRWIADRQVLSGDEDAIVGVVVRFAGSSDYFIAKNIKEIIEGHAGWPVTLDGDLTIEPNNEFKVLFESDLRKTFDEIADAFKHGHLLNDYSVGVSRRHDVLKDRRHLVVVVTPAVMQ